MKLQEIRCKRWLCALCIGLALSSAPARAEEDAPPVLEMTPPIEINGNDVLAEAPKRGRVVLTYDVRPVGGQGVDLYVTELPIDPHQPAEPERVHFQGAQGQVPVDFYDKEAGIYLFSAQAVDAEGRPVADFSRGVNLRYGGGRAMDNYNKRRLQMFGLPGKTKVFKDIVPYDEIPDLATELKPQMAVIKPGEKVRLSFKFALDNVKDKKLLAKVAEDYDTHVYWRLHGPGKLRTLSDTEALYEAPEEGEHTVKVSVKFVNQVNESTVVVTNMKVGGL